MSLDFPDRDDWLKVRETLRKLHRERIVYAGGTYVRERDSAKENARLTWYQEQCNGNARRGMSRKTARRAAK